MEEIQIINEDQIKNMVYEIRGQQVMLDFELAEIYGYETKNFNRQVKNNIEKFDDDFMFRLTDEEVVELSRCKNFTLNKGTGRGSNIKYNPYAFTEQGIYMLMTVLKGELAIKQSKALIRLFKRMKDYILENQYLISPKDFMQLSHRVDLLAEKQKNFVTKEDLLIIENDLSIVMENFIDESKLKHFLIMNGEKIEADIAYINIYSLAKYSLYIVDNYISLKTLELLRAVKDNIEIIIFSDNLHHNNKLTKNIYDDFIKEYPNINIKLKKTEGKYHDRYIIIDYNTSNATIYHSGSSIKDAGNKITTIQRIEKPELYNGTIKELLMNKELYS